MQPLHSAYLSRFTQLGLRRRKAARGISLVELTFVIVIIVLLSLLVLATMARARNLARSVACVSNLKAIHSAFLLYADANNQRYPASRSITKRNWESLLSPYIGPSHAFQCPADSDIFQYTGSSYDWRDMPDNEDSLAGKSSTGPLRQDRILAYETLPGWHGKHMITVVRLSGTAGLIDENQCFDDLSAPVMNQPNKSK